MDKYTEISLDDANKLFEASADKTECVLNLRVYVTKEYRKKTVTPYLIRCVKDEDFGSCGESSYISKEEYLKQLANPHRGWSCPKCGCYPCGFEEVS